MEIFIVWCKLIRKFPDSSLILILLTFLEKFHLCAWNWRYLLPIGCFTNNVGLLFLLLRLEKAILLGLLLNGTYFNNYFFVIIILVPTLEFLRCCWIIKLFFVHMEFLEIAYLQYLRFPRFLFVYFNF